MMKRSWSALTGVMMVLSAAGADAQSPRDLLTQASFIDRDRAVALRRVTAAQTAATIQLQRAPGDREAALMQATALGYRAKLTGSRGDAIAARKLMEQLVARLPTDPERQILLGAWHTGAVDKLGRLVARAALGASKAAGLAAIDRGVALGGTRAMFPALAAMLRLGLDPADPRGRPLLEAAIRGTTPTAMDRRFQRGAAAMLPSVRAGDRDTTRKLAKALLPLGSVIED
ncbi:hypothetical protein [uncultured Sphingomonas sp.]|uniref:hypothetical protein n=1 Tax=uncultured Sphingomonas sp. TaxID=158754 RepID=UPI0035CC6E00